MSDDSKEPNSKSKAKAKTVVKISATKPKARKGRVVMNMRQKVIPKNTKKKRD